MKESNHSEHVRIVGRIILKWILKKESGRVWTGILRLVIGTSDVLCVNTAMKLWVPLNYGNFMTNGAHIPFERGPLLHGVC